MNRHGIDTSQSHSSLWVRVYLIVSKESRDLGGANDCESFLECRFACKKMGDRAKALPPKKQDCLRILLEDPNNHVVGCVLASCVGLGWGNG